MTGFSRTLENTDLGSISLEVSSVNHRNQEINIRLPRELSRYEQNVQERIREVSRRGKIQVRIDICWDSCVKAASIESGVLKQYAEEIQRIRSEMGLKDEIALELLLNLPGVVSSEQLSQDNLEGILDDPVRSLINRGVCEWDKMRSIEGEHLQSAIISSIEDLRKVLLSIKEKWVNARDNALQAHKDRVRQVLDNSGVAADENRVAQEIVLLGDKWDISEELARTTSHMDKFCGIVHNDEVSGKTLDFLVQEMNREMNTIASKVQDADIRWISVEAKSLLESIREQIQNVE
jgi:uncharacterized protein (TIGR00255 family)